MPVLPSLLVVFVGISGPDAAKLDHQVGSLLHKDAKVQTAKVSAADLKTLTHHGDGARAIVRKLHADGVVGGELIEQRGQVTLRMVVYDGDGGMKDMLETPLGGKQLARADIESLRSNLMPDVAELAGTGGGDDVAAADGASDDGADETPAPPPPPKAKGGKAKKAAAPAPVADDLPAIGDDDENPLSKGKGQKSAKAAKPVREEIAAAPSKSAKRAVAAKKPAPPADDTASDDASPSGDETAAAPTETADASDDTVSADEMMEATMGGGDGGGEVDASATAEPSLRIGASVGLGIATRGFSAPTTLAGYSSSAVGSVRFEATVQPSERTALGLLGERSLGMSTPLADGAAPTLMQRWQAQAAYALVRGPVQIAPMVGVGWRTFAIESTDLSRTPDSNYGYFLAGANVSSQLGKHVSLGGMIAFEPVLAGAEPTEMAFGEATRWGLELGAAVEVRPHDHVFVRAAANYQRFTWSWDMAGARAAGGATDEYPSGTLSVGADY